MTIYIRPDGTISGSNEPLPVRPKEEWTDCTHNYGGYVYGYGIAIKNYGNALTAWKESCKDFKQDGVEKKLLLEKIGGYYAPDTIIENVDVETEEVANLKNPCPRCGANLREQSQSPCTDITCYKGMIGYKRTVLRIKDKP